ncbi:cytokine receptor common subunit beta isoform X2 [Trachinotus anak]|uniref:cytokine receptor common subunit beta isoform X2 n=1 Tax=Trachinotus anak TaxID=443729 RepID=UPI0039F1DB95
MMPLFWVVLWPVLPPLALLSAPDNCTVHDDSSSSQDASPWLQSLQCHNNYQTYVHCEWREHRNTSLQLWFTTGNNRELCEPYSPPVQGENRTQQCRYNSSVFAIGIKHTVFFLENKPLTVCSSATQQPLYLSQHLRSRPPVDLSTHDAGDGGRLLNWSSPYPPSSSWNKNLTYQLSYRADTQKWTTVSVMNTSLKLERQLLLLHHRYEARVRARASLGQWSHWSPVVTWKTEDDTGQFPSLHCVLDGEKEVMCSWEVNRELAHFITYQLACRHNRTAPSERCCMKPTVSSGPNGTVLKYNCSLTVADPAHLLLELQPVHNAKTFKPHQHIHPNPPQQVKVWEKDHNWIVEWTLPSLTSIVPLHYQVCYYKTQEEECSSPLNVTQGSMPLTLLGESLAPSQQYQVKVRSLVLPGQGSEYKGIPSEWTDPVDWTTHAATFSLATLIYVLISVFVVTVFFTLYCTIPACRRRVIVWVDSVPSPDKSKILSEIKSATSWTFMQSEDMSICNEQHYDTISTCSLWPTTDTDKKCLEADKSFWASDNLPTPPEKASESSSKSVDVKCQEKEKEKAEKSVTDDPPSPVNFSLYGEGYVCLPNRTASTSTQDLISHSDANTNTHRDDCAEQNQQCPDTTLGPDKTDVQPGLSEAISMDQPPPYTTGPFIPWPQGSTINTLGYCHLPQPQ